MVFAMFSICVQPVLTLPLMMHVGKLFMKCLLFFKLTECSDGLETRDVHKYFIRLQAKISV